MPWVERDGMANIFTAYPAYKPDMDLPEGMTVTRKPVLGKRVATRGGSAFGRMSGVSASWPEDKMHSARTPKLCFIITGPVEFRVNNYVLHCHPGHGILLPPGIPFANGENDFLDQGRQHRGIYEMLQMMSYQGGLVCWLTLGKQDAQGKIHKTTFTCTLPHSKVPFYLDQLLDEATKDDLHRHSVCNHLLGLAITLLHRELQQTPTLRTGEIYADDAPPSGQKEFSIAQAQEYIVSNLREPLSIDRVARHVCMTRTVFTAQFRARTGKSFARYVRDLRFEEASKLLRETDLSISQIGPAVGLQPHYLRVLFHERENASPLEYRNRYRKEK
jgi:AraC-like DNA-binding protein